MEDGLLGAVLVLAAIQFQLAAIYGQLRRIANALEASNHGRTTDAV